MIDDDDNEQVVSPKLSHITNNGHCSPAHELLNRVHTDRMQSAPQNAPC